jgi:hypothetical protein
VTRLRLGIAPDFQNSELMRLSDALKNFKIGVSRFLAAPVA